MRLCRLAATAVVLALVGLTGCGKESVATLTRVHDFTAYGGKAPASTRPTDGKPVPADLWAKFLTSFTTCTSVRVDGAAPTNSTSTATLNLAGTCDGSNGRLQMAMEAQSLEVITVAGTYYVKANTAFWRASGASSATINAIGSRYLATTDPKIGGYTVATLFAQIKAAGALGGTTDLTVEAVTQGGQAAYKLVRGARTSASSVTVWVTVRDAVPLRVKIDDPAGAMDLTFSDWNVVAPFTAPPAAQVVKV